MLHTFGTKNLLRHATKLMLQSCTCVTTETAPVEHAGTHPFGHRDVCWARSGGRLAFDVGYRATCQEMAK